MRIEIVSDAMGVDVRLSSADRRDFGALLGLFKSCIVEACRRYDSDARVWRVEKRAQRQLERFIAMAEESGAQIVSRTERREVVTLPEMANRREATQPGYLMVSDTDDSGGVLAYRAKQKAEKRPAVIITKHGRWASLRATVYGGAMNDKTKHLVFDYLLAGALANSQIRVSNREVLCSKLSFGLSVEMAAWLAHQLSNADNITAGVMNGREHSRLEALKRDDGRVKMIQGGVRRAA